MIADNTMLIKVHTHSIELDEETKQKINEQEINITKCRFEFDEEITEDYVKSAYFTLGNATYKQVIANNECDIPSEVLSKVGTITLGVTATLIENEIEIKRYNPSPTYFDTILGSLKDASNVEPITPTEYEQYLQLLNDGLAEAEHVDIDASKTGNKTTVSITNRQNETKNVDIYDGDSGITIFHIDNNGHLIATSESGSNLTNYSLSNGHLWLTIGE